LPASASRDPFTQPEQTVYGFSYSTGTAASLRYNAGHRLLVTGNNDFLPLNDPVEQLTKSGLGLERAYGAHINI
jgi:hypothetical protein